MIVGSAGHATAVADVIDQIVELTILGVFDRFEKRGSVVGRHTVLGAEEDILALCSSAGTAGVAVAMGIGDNFARSQSVRALVNQVPALEFPLLVHPRATVSPTARIGRGTVVMPGAIVNANATIGEFCIVNTKASVDHECVIEDYASLAPGVTIGGRVHVGRFSAVGLGANVIHKRAIGQHTVVGAGSTVLQDLPDQIVAYGTPARVIRPRHIGEPYL